MCFLGGYFQNIIRLFKAGRSKLNFSARAYPGTHCGSLMRFLIVFGQQWSSVVQRNELYQVLNRQYRLEGSSFGGFGLFMGQNTEYWQLEIGI